jgi:hypothetical protein
MALTRIGYQMADPELSPQLVRSSYGLAFETL